MPVKIINVVGARPNFMKIAPLMDAYQKTAGIHPLLVHTGQHYDSKMSDVFFRQLGIPEPDINLGVGSGSHAVQTAQIMVGFEKILLEHKPDAVLVVGDVNSTIACGIVAVKMGIKLVHVEAGLRSFDRSMPEEINRVLTDSVSDLLFCTEQSGVDNLNKEGVDGDRVHLVGNLMIDTLVKNADKAERSAVLNDLKISPKGYAVLTLHRPANVDDPACLGQILRALGVIQKELPIIFPIHPRTQKNLLTGPLAGELARMPDIRLVEPLGYLDFLKLTANARVVLTDSGGIQEETLILKVPCITLRENTERPVTVDCGGNRLVGSDPRKIVQAYRQMCGGDGGAGQITPPPLWDGKAAERTVKILLERLSR